jgi:uncharacterized protein (DUF305 family)
MLTDDARGSETPTLPDADEATEPEPRAGLGLARTIALVVVLCFLAGFFGWWIAQPDDESFNDVDVGFLTDMTTHHNGAIGMGFTYLGRENDPSVGHFAREIVLGQSQESAVMNELLADAGGARPDDADVAMEWMGQPVAAARMPGMATEGELDALRASEGLAADDAFTRLMIRHHAGGIAMAEFAAEHGENERVRNLAAAMAKVQRTEIVEMEMRRQQLGLPPVDTSDIDGVHGGRTMR